MQPYPLFVALSVVTVLMPGPAVVMTLSNRLAGGLAACWWGIAGFACGYTALVLLAMGGVGVAALGAPQGMGALRLVAAALLAYLGLRLWRAPPLAVVPAGARATATARRCFVQGALLQFVNPYALVFVTTVWPQFLNRSASLPLMSQVLLLLAIHTGVTVGIHGSYAVLAGRARRWLSTEGGARALRRVGALLYFGFGASLLLRAWA